MYDTYLLTYLLTYLYEKVIMQAIMQRIASRNFRDVDSSIPAPYFFFWEDLPPPFQRDRRGWY